MQKQITNKQMTVGTAAAVIVVALTMGSEAQAAEATGTAQATVVIPISIAATSVMEFGNIAGTPTAGTVVLTTASVATGTNVDVLSGTTPAAAVFTVTGFGNTVFTMTLPADNVVTLIDGTGASMSLSTFTSDVASALSGGTEVFAVGATLGVGINQSTGAYSGTYTVTVNYN